MNKHKSEKWSDNDHGDDDNDINNDDDNDYYRRDVYEGVIWSL